MSNLDKKQENPTTKHSEEELQALLKELWSLEKSLFPESDWVVDWNSTDSEIDWKYTEEMKKAWDIITQIQLIEELIKDLWNREKANKWREFLKKFKIFEWVRFSSDNEVIHLMWIKDKVEKVENLYSQALNDSSKEWELIAFINNPENWLYSIREYVDEYKLLSQIYLKLSRKEINIDDSLVNSEDYPEIKWILYKYWTINDWKTRQLLGGFIEQSINNPSKNIDSLKEFINKNINRFFTLENVGDYFNITDIFILLQSFIVRSKESPEEQQKEYDKIIDFSDLFEKAEKINSLKENYEKIVEYYKSIWDENTLQSIKELVKPKENEWQERDLWKAIDWNTGAMLKVIQRYWTNEALWIKDNTEKEPKLPKELQEKHWKQIKELTDAWAKVDENWNLSIKTPINLWVNWSIEMWENWELIYMSSLWYNFKFDKDLNKSWDKIFEIKEQMDFLDKVWFWFFWGNFRTMIETIQENYSLIPSTIWINIQEWIWNENDFLSMSETIHICDIFKKIWFLWNEINPNNLTNPTMTRWNFVGKIWELREKYWENSFYNESWTFSKIAFEKVIIKEFSSKK